MKLKMEKNLTNTYFVHIYTHLPVTLMYFRFQLKRKKGQKTKLKITGVTIDLAGSRSRHTQISSMYIFAPRPEIERAATKEEKKTDLQKQILYKLCIC